MKRMHPRVARVYAGLLDMRSGLETEYSKVTLVPQKMILDRTITHLNVCLAAIEADHE